MNLDQVEAEALKLSPGARARLAARLLQSLETLSEEESAHLWEQEALRRHDELDRGDVAPRAADDVLRDARSRFA